MSAKDDVRYAVVAGERTALRLELPAFGKMEFGASDTCDGRVRETGVAPRHLTVHADTGLAVAAHAAAFCTADTSTSDLPTDEVVDVAAADRIGLGEAALMFAGEEPEPETSARVWTSSALDRFAERADFAVRRTLTVGSSVDPTDVAEQVLGCVPSGARVGVSPAGTVEVLMLERGTPEWERTLAYELETRKVSAKLVPAGESQPEEDDGSPAPSEAASAPAEPPARLRDELAALEKKRILEALDRHDTQAEAAKSLDMPLRTFLSRLKSYGITRSRK